MIRQLRILLGAAACLIAIGATTAQPTQAVPATVSTPAMITWQSCPAYSDETLKWMVPPDQFDEFKQLWARTECGTLRVPLDHRHPLGRQITIAVTRLKAIDQAHRLGSIALNPGGPGGSGYLMPLRFFMAHRNGNGEKLNQRYDLIGFDPRGVGYSTRAAECPDSGPPPSLAPSPVTEEKARRLYEWVVRTNQACGNSDPEFLGQLTTANVARDLDMIRRGLHERTLSYLGISWGTWLGAVYRSLFPRNVQLMWLDSTGLPDFRLDVFEDVRAKATSENFSRMAAWMAGHNDVYGFGSTAAEVKTALARMRSDFDAHPRTFTDIPEWIFDGFMIAQISAQQSLSWVMAAPILAALRDSTSGSAAPPLLKEVFGGPPTDGPTPPPTPPAELPQDFNPVMNQAVFCNEDTGPRDFESAWGAYQQRLELYPVTGEFSQPVPMCAGWPLPTQPVRVRHADASLVMSAHRYETLSPYVWTRQMQDAIGGSVLTVDDDIHGSVAALETDCAPRIAAYFYTGQPDNGECQGVPVPTSTDLPPPPEETAATAAAQAGPGQAGPQRSLAPSGTAFVPSGTTLVPARTLRMAAATPWPMR